MIDDDFDIGQVTAGSGGVPVDVSRHARQRWIERVGRGRPLDGSTWRSADFVVAPGADCDEARVAKLAGSRDMLLCGKHHPDRTVIATVMYADYDRLRYP